MLFGLMNAPFTFQQLVSRVLVGCETFTSAYIDDILVFSRDEAEYEQHLKQVLQCLARYNLRMKLKKCSFFQQEMPFLGHVLSQGCVKVEPQKIEALQRWKRPLTTVKLGSHGDPPPLVETMAPRGAFSRESNVGVGLSAP